MFKGRVFEVIVDTVRLPDGSQATREVVRHPGAVAVVALVEGSFLMVRQNRHAVGRDLLEVPAGKLDIPGEGLEECARRELEEETGYTCESLQPLVSFLTSPGFCDEFVHLFLTTDARRVSSPPASDEGEPISIEWLSLLEVQQAIRDGRLVDSKSIIGLTLAAGWAGPE